MGLPARARRGGARGDEDARLALRRAVDAYRDDLVQGASWVWVEPVRQDLHRRALDAHLRLAELEEEAGNLAAAIEVLDCAVDLDRYADEPYGRLMALQAHRGRPTLQLLQRRLVELDLEGKTARLYATQSKPDTTALTRSVGGRRR